MQTHVLHLKEASSPKWSLGSTGKIIGPFLYDLTWVTPGKACIPTMTMDTRLYLAALKNTLSRRLRSLLYGPSIAFFLPS